MNNSFTLIPLAAANKLAVAEIIKCNEITARYGLVLSPAEAQELAETRTKALGGTGRIEFAGSIINKLIMKFCDSPYLSKYNYAETLNDLIETFYYFKNETLDELSDDEMISFMKNFFDQNCRGSMELLQNRELEILARNIRFGICDEEESYDE